MARVNRLDNGCTPMENEFARQFARCWKPKLSAERAGYSARTAASQASKLLKRQHVLDAIGVYSKRISDKADINAADIQRGLWHNAVRCQQGEPVFDRDGQPTGVWAMDSAGSNRAYELLGKMQGLFIDKRMVVLDEAVQRIVDEFGEAVADELRDHPKLLEAISRRFRAIAAQAAAGGGR